jgi:RNA polymerase sigma factor (sigma-70 family)
MQNVLRYVRRLAAIDDARSSEDGALLRRFVETRDEDAFAAILARHGPMVLAVGRRVLHNQQDAEDILQAAFLVFARKAATIRRGDSLRSWLYGIAYRLALRVRAKAIRQRTQENLDAVPAEAMTVSDLQPILDEELERLPEKYRLPILLCCLDGKSRDEAARELGWKEGAVKIRLERGRELLRNNLGRRGIALPLAFATAWLIPQAAHAALPTRLSAATMEAANRLAAGEPIADLVPQSVASLSQGMIQSLAAAQAKFFAMTGGALLSVLALAGYFAWSISVPPKMPPPMALFKIPEAQPAAPPPAIEAPAPQTLVGTLRGMNEARTTIVIRDHEKDVSIPLAPNYLVAIEGDPASLRDIKPGSRVEIEFSAEGFAAALRAEGPIARMRFESLEPDGSAMTFQAGDGGKKRTLPLRPSARLDAVERLRQISVGAEVAVQLTHDRESIVRLVSVPTLRTKTAR